MQLHTTKWICFVVGYVFATSGILKLVDSDFQAVFKSLGLPFPGTTLFIVAIAEIACGMLLIGRMYVKQATIPLLVIILGALYLTKLPILFEQGLLTFAFDARLDIVMLILLLVLGQHLRTIRKPNV